MGVECLLVTCDSVLYGQVKAALGSRGVSLDLRQDSASAIEFASRRHLAGVIIDCDDVPGGTEAILHLRHTRANQQGLIFAVVNSPASAQNALDLGANYSLCKPVHESRLQSILDIAVPTMEREHARYFRYDVDLPVTSWNRTGQAFSARMKNISEGGLAVKLVDPVKMNGVVKVEFEVPSIEHEVFHAKAEVVWSDSFVMGLRFLHVAKESAIVLQQWLSSLQSQFQLRESIQCTG
jgi:ActR/RegA family two-component response regulator